MTAALRPETVTAATGTAPTDDARRQWWQGVQLGVSAMLTEAARRETPPRLAH